jgi:hypothetical protein
MGAASGEGQGFGDVPPIDGVVIDELTAAIYGALSL